MPSETLKEVLMERDGLSEEEADVLIEDARDDLIERINDGEWIDDGQFMADWFSLEPDWFLDLLP